MTRRTLWGDAVGDWVDVSPTYSRRAYAGIEWNAIEVQRHGDQWWWETWRRDGDHVVPFDEGRASTREEAMTAADATLFGSLVPATPEAIAELLALADRLP